MDFKAGPPEPTVRLNKSDPTTSSLPLAIPHKDSPVTPTTPNPTHNKPSLRQNLHIQADDRFRCSCIERCRHFN